MSSRILTTANQITILRLAFVPLFVIFIAERHYAAGLVILGLAAISDAVDGLIARKLHQESAIGVALDPLADKFLMTAAYLVLAFRNALPWWLTILVLSRDVAIVVTALLIILVAGYRAFPPSLLGKLSTASQISTIFLAVASKARIPLATSTLRGLIYLTAVLTVASGIHYLISTGGTALTRAMTNEKSSDK